jgi:Domain of unknown function (DUF4136)
MKTFSMLILACSVIWVTACSALSVSVSTSFEPGTDFSRFKTYAWMPRSTDDSVQETVVAATVGHLIMDDVEKTLAARGYEKNTSGTPDFYLTYRGYVQEKVVPKVTPYMCGERVCGQDITSETIKQGTLILDVIQADSKQVVWRGTAVGMTDPSQREQLIAEAVQQLFKKFPPS